MHISLRHLVIVFAWIFVGVFLVLGQGKVSRSTQQQGTSRDFCFNIVKPGMGGCPVGENIPFETPLLEAIRQRDIPLVKSLIADGANVNHVDSRGVFPLLLVSGGDFELIDILIKAGADVNAESKYGATPLINSTMCSRAVRKFLASGAEVNRRNINNESALSSAAKHGNLESVKILLEAGADITLKDVNEMTPLLHAVQSGQLEVVELIYSLGGRKDLGEERSAAMALMIAAGNSQHEMLAFLLHTARIDPNSRAKYGTTAMTTAAMRGKPEIVKLLLDAGAEPNIRGPQTAAPLTWAANYGHSEIVKLLLEAGADINVKEDWSPLISAARKGHPETVKVLIEAGGKINEQAYDGRTGLMDAVTGGHLEVVRVLIEAGADLNIRDEDDNVTALGLALKMTESGQPNPKYLEIIRLLRQAGAVE